jgi:hypothetical protein
MSTYTLTYTSKLTEDYIHSTSMLASGTATQPIASFLNSTGQSEALLVHDDGELCHLLREPLSSSGWNIVGIGAVVDTIAAADSGTVWITDDDQSIWMSNAGHWNPIQTLPGGAQTLSIMTDGTVYATVNENGQYVQYTYDPVAGQFGNPQNIAYTTPPVGSGQYNMWVISEGAVLTTNNIMGTFMDYPVGLPDNGSPQRIYFSTDGTVWVLSDQGNIFNPTPDGTDWVKPATPTDINAFAPLNYNVFYVLSGFKTTGNGTLYSCDGNGNNTVQAQPAGRALKDISVGLDGTLWGLDTIGSVWRFANGGWVRMIQPTDLSGFTGGHQVTEVVTGRHAMGSQYAFYVFADANGTPTLYYSKFEETQGIFGGYWTGGGSMAFSGCSKIGIVTDPSTSYLIVYGVSDAGNLVIVEDVGGGNFQGTEHKMNTSLAGSSVVLAPITEQKWLTCAVINQALYTGMGSAANNPAGSLSQVKGAPPVASLIPFSTHPDGMWAEYIGLIDTSGQIWLVNFGNNSFTQLSGSAVQSPIGAVDGAVGMITSIIDGTRIYAYEHETSMLWVLRQSGGTWAQWHPLGNEVTRLATGCTFQALSGNPAPVDLFSLDAGPEVNVLSEDPTTGALTDLVMLKPAGTNEDAEYVTRYVTEVTITDENSLPQRNFALTVAADETVGIWVGTSLYTVTPASPVTLNTDSHGIITFAFFAGDLRTPTFSFSADGLQSPPTIWPAQEVNNYLQGKAGALPDRPAFDPKGNALLGAQMQTAPDWAPNATTSFVATDTAKANAPSAANAINQMYQIAPAGGTAGQWSVADSAGGLVGGSSFWHDLCNFGHDIDHAIKKAALKIASVAVDIENKAISFTMQLANGASQLLKLAINAFKDVISAMKSAFRFIERGVEDAIHWLKSLFAWGDVVNTKRVLKAGVNGMMSRFQTNLDPTSSYYIGTLFNTYFDEDVKDKIKAGFAKLNAQFGTNSISSTAGPSPNFPPAAGTDTLHPDNVSNTRSSNGTQTNYVHGHMKSYSSNGGKFPAQAGGDGSSGDGVLAKLYNAIATNLKNNNGFSPYETCSSFQGIFSNPKAFADVVIYDILDTMQNTILAILDVIEGVFDALFELAGNALAGFQNFLNKQIDIPVISWLYKKISGDPLTLLDLFCLFLAVPTTIVYKLTFGMPNANPPFTQAEAEALETQYAPENFPWPAVAGGAAAASASSNVGGSVAAVNNNALGAAQQGLGSFPFPAAWMLMVLNGATYAIVDCINDLSAHSTNVEQLTDPDFEDPLASICSGISIVTTFIGQWLTAPYNIFPGPTTTAEKMTMAMWAMNFLPFVSGVVFVSLSPDHALSEFNSSYGPYICTAIGTILLAVGIATTVEQIEDSTHNYNPCYWVQNIIAPLPTIFKPLVTITDEPAGSVATGFLIAGDALFDMANMGLAFAEDV